MQSSELRLRRLYWLGIVLSIVILTFFVSHEFLGSPTNINNSLILSKLRTSQAEFDDRYHAIMPCRDFSDQKHSTSGEIFSDLQFKNMRVLEMRLKSRLQGRNVSFGFMLPDWELYPSYPGVSWYKDTLLTKRFAPMGICGSVCLTHLLEAQGKGHAGSWFVDAGAHLGAFTAFAAALGHSIVNIDGNPSHKKYWKLTAQLNSWEDRHVPIHAVVGNVSGRQMEFSDGELSSAGNRGQYTATTVTLDEVIEKHISVRGDKVAGIFIDVEGFEQEVLLGLKKNLKKQSAGFINVELWFRKEGVDRTSFPGLELLLVSGYKLFNHLGEEFTMVDMAALAKAVCVGDMSLNYCLMEIMALRTDMLSSFTELDVSRMHHGQE